MAVPDVVSAADPNQRDRRCDAEAQQAMPTTAKNALTTRSVINDTAAAWEVPSTKSALAVASEMR